MFPKSTIDEVVDSTQPSVCVGLATIRSVDERHGWFYVACRIHHKKMVKMSEFINLEDTETQDEQNDGGLYCLKCKGKASSVFPSFKLQVRVQGSTGTTSFVLFDRELVKLIHKNAYELREKHEREGDPDSFPDDFNDLVGKRYLFKIHVSNYNIDIGYQVYTIMKVCDDPNIISAFMETYPDDQDDDEVANGLVANINDDDDASIDNTDVLSSSDDSSTTCADNVQTATSPNMKRSRNEFDKGGIGDCSSSKKKFIQVKIDKCLS